jgi:tetratricopeptide (TPR) repeat protein
MTEALISDLARIGAVRVISQTSVMRYKSKQRSLPQIARELNVDAVVEGTVLRSGEQVRVAARLIHAPTGLQLWADSYERFLRDIPALEQEVARAIAGEIRIKLTPRDEARLTNARPVDPQAVEVYLKGRLYLDKRNEEALKTAIAYFQEATRRDAAYALPQVALSDAYFALGTVNVGALPPAEALRKGMSAALKALELDDTLAEAHTALGVIKLYSWEWREAEQEFNRAVALNPNYAPAYSWHGIFLAARGRVGEALAKMYRAREIDPLSPHISQNVGWVLMYAHQYDEAIEQYKRALQLDPNFLFARLRLAGAYQEKRMFREALSEFEHAIRISNWSPSALSGLGHAYAVAGRPSEARQILRELLASRDRRYVNSSSIAAIYLGLGEKDRALEWLERAYREHSYQNVFLKVDETFAPLRADPRFQDLLRRVGLLQ